MVSAEDHHVCVFLMATLTHSEIGDILQPFYQDCSVILLDQLSQYLDLLVKWNSRTNLSSIREPRQIVRRHFGESLFVARHLPPAHTLLDLGSGAGFPGIPIQIARPNLRVTLAESQNKKSTFLREAVRTLGLNSEVYAGRVEEMRVSQQFEVVTLRAVDRPELALALARERMTDGGLILQLSALVEDCEQSLLVPGSLNSFLNFIR